MRRVRIKAAGTAFVASGLIVFLVIACGPSFRRTAQSDNAFLRCFDLDYRPGVSIETKLECWTGWTEKHVYNQPEDKMSYARLRLGELGDGISVPGPPGPPGDFDNRPLPPVKKRKKGEPFPIAAAAVAPSGDPDGGNGFDGGVASAVVADAECEAICLNAFSACSGVCSESPGESAGCMEACDSGYRSCVRSCGG